MKRPLSLFLSVCVSIMSGIGFKTTAFAESTGPDVQEYTLPSGQKVYIRENHTQPIVTIDTWVKTGSVNEVGDNNGVSHFLEHLLFKGTDQYKTGEIDRLLESKGSKFNAATSDDYTHYYITTASPFFDETMKLHASMLRRASIPPEELDRERKVVQEEINRATDNPDYKRFSTLSRLIHGNHGYALDTLGPKENIAKIPRDNILAYYQYWYQPQNFNTIISGDVDPKEALKLVESYFAQPPNLKTAEPYSPPPVGKPEIPKQPKVKVITDPSVSQSYFTLGFPAPSIESRNDNYALDVAMLALGSGASSRLYQALHEKKPLVTSIGAGNMTQKYAGILYVDAEMKPENADAAKAEIFRQLASLKADGITQQELDKAKTQTIKDFIFHNESTDGVATSIGYNVSIGNLKDYTEYVANIQKVTLADVKDALNRYLDYNKGIIVELVPPGKTPNSQDIPKAEARDLKLLQNAASGTVPAPQPVSTQAPQGQQEITRQILNNGMTLLSKPLKNSQTVAFKIFVRGGQLADPVPGVSDLTSSVLMQGTTDRNSETISRELESRGMHLGVTSHEDYIEVTGSAVSEDLGELFLVLSDVLTHPAFAPEEVAKEKGHLKQEITASRDNPSSIALENLSTALYPHHPYGNVGKRIESHLDQITRDQLVDYFKTYFVPKNMVVSVVGNFNEEIVKDYLESAFPSSMNGNFDMTSFNQYIQKAGAVAPIPKDETIEEKRPIKGATWIAQGWLAPSIDNTKDYVPMKVLNSLLGSGMSSRLFVDLREKQGLAYVVSSAYPSLGDKGNFFMFIGTEPKNQAKVLEDFGKEIARLKTELVSTQELQAAKDKLRGSFALAHETNNSQAYYLGFYETVGVGYGFDQTYPGLIEKVTPEDILRVAQTYFSQPYITSIVAPQSAPPEKTAAGPAGKGGKKTP